MVAVVVVLAGRPAEQRIGKHLLAASRDASKETAENDSGDYSSADLYPLLFTPTSTQRRLFKVLFFLLLPLSFLFLHSSSPTPPSLSLTLFLYLSITLFCLYFFLYLPFSLSSFLIISSPIHSILLSDCPDRFLPRHAPGVHWNGGGRPHKLGKKRSLFAESCDWLSVIDLPMDFAGLERPLVRLVSMCYGPCR